MKRSLVLLAIAIIIFFARPVVAGAPSGDFWFQLITSSITSPNNDATGDGGTGNYDDLNYYYVGQYFDTRIQIGVTSSTQGSSAADIMIYYPTTTLSVSSAPSVGTYYDNWAGQTYNTSTGLMESTGYNNGGVLSPVSSDGSFGSVHFYAYTPTEANYGTSTPALIDINFTGIGDTVDSNISYAGYDYMDSAEDFLVHVWADITRPYAFNPNPTSGAIGIVVEGNFTFSLCDSKGGETADGGTCASSGVGTGVDITTPPGEITFDDGTGAQDYTVYDSYFCSGVWGSNLCNTTINPSSPTSIPGDTRNWNYNTTYTVNVRNFRDLASSQQDQLGDPNGPNTSTLKTWSFTTESDTVKPQVVSESPLRGSTGNSVSTNLVITLHDKKTYPGSISGSGVVSSSCKFEMHSATFSSTVYTSGSSELTIVPVDYGYEYTINPATNFAQNETVYVSVYDCQDVAGNTMITDNYSFSTADTGAPYVTSISPADDASIATNGTISFHIKDDGVGVDLNSVVFYINGVYYTNGGGAGQVTINGTRITFGSSLDFNGGNYAGDTTLRSGTANDYTFLVDPQTDFTAGEAVPVEIFASDSSGNLMERVIYANVVLGGTGGTCPATGGSSGGGGGGTTILSLYYINVFQVSESSVLMTWYSSLPGTGRVVYGTQSPATYGQSPNYNYQQSTVEVFENVIYHSALISGLVPGQIYYARPVTRSGGNEVRGDQVLLTPKFATETIIQIEKEVEVRYLSQVEADLICSPIDTSPGVNTTTNQNFCPKPIVCPVIKPIDQTIVETPSIGEGYIGGKILISKSNWKNVDRYYYEKMGLKLFFSEKNPPIISGTGAPGMKFRLIIN